MPYIHAMLLVPKGVVGEWLDGVYWTLAAEMAFYGLVFCAMLTKKVTLRHVAFGLTIYSAVFNAVALLVLSCTTPSDLPYLVILMFRVPCADGWLLFRAGHLALHFRKQKIDGSRKGRRRRHLSFGCRRNLLFCLFLFDEHSRHLGSIGTCADHGLGIGGGPHCLVREQEEALCTYRLV